MVAPREATFYTRRGTNHRYGITSLQEQKNSLDVSTCMIKVFTIAIDALLDPGASL